MEEPKRTRESWSTRKKDNAPRGLYWHPSGAWAIRFTCGAGHIHKQKVGALKGDAGRVYHDRRGRALTEPGWCPGIEARQGRARVQAEERARITLQDYAEEYK